jgi:VWFA-related protein
VTRLALAIAACQIVQAPQEPPPRFRVGVESVSVDVLVTDGNRAVAGLRASDFELRDSGVAQTIAATEMNDVPLSLLVALDTSSSVQGPMLRRLAEATRAAVDLLKPVDRAALVTFSHVLALRAGWGASPEALHTALAQAEGTGFTSLNDAAFAALTLRDDRPGTRSLVLLFSDGEDSMSWLPEQAVVEKARRTDAVVYTVGNVDHTSGRSTRYGAEVQLWPRDPRQLREASSFFRELAEITGGHTFRVPQEDDLRETFARIVTDFRSRYVLTYTPAGVDHAGWHPIEVKVKGRRGRVTARRGYVK